MRKRENLRETFCCPSLSPYLFCDGGAYACACAYACVCACAYVPKTTRTMCWTRRTRPCHRHRCRLSSSFSAFPSLFFLSFPSATDGDGEAGTGVGVGGVCDRREVAGDGRGDADMNGETGASAGEEEAFV